jgi:hypothetical protein
MACRSAASMLAVNPARHFCNEPAGLSARKGAAAALAACWRTPWVSLDDSLDRSPIGKSNGTAVGQTETKRTGSFACLAPAPRILTWRTKDRGKGNGRKEGTERKSKGRERCVRTRLLVGFHHGALHVLVGSGVELPEKLHYRLWRQRGVAQHDQQEAHLAGGPGRDDSAATRDDRLLSE